MTTEVTVLISAVSFLTGTLITVLIFVFGFRDRLTRVEESVKAMQEAMKTLALAVNSRPVCEFHADIDRGLALNKERIKDLKAQVDQLKKD